MTGLLMAGAVLGLLAVVLGAFAAHVLRERLSAERFTTFQVGVQYQMYHALAIVASAAVASRAPRLAWDADMFFLVGVVLFSGSLYLVSLMRLRKFGMIAPIGGLSLIVGWALLFAVIMR